MMESEQSNLEKNISRLVKLAGDPNILSEEFADSLMKAAVDELKESKTGRRREEGGPMKTKWTKMLAYAASIIIVSGVVVALTLSSLNRTRQYPLSRARQYPSHQINASEQEKQLGLVQHDKKMIVEVPAAQPVDVAKATPAKPPVLERSNVDVFYGYQDSIALNSKDSSTSAVVDADGLLGMQRKLSGTPSSVDLFMSFRPREAGRVASCTKPEPALGGYPMAHGGTTPPNGEDVDAMFFKNYGVNPFIDTEDDHLSTFATDVDTGSYTIVRGFLQDGHLPPEKAVRVEEFVNYFKYDYPAPQEDVFAVYAEAAPWKFGTGRKNSYLLRLGLKAKQVSEENRKPANLTFVIDVSGSMNREDRLGLVKKCLRMLVERLKEQDRVGIAVYGSRGRKVMGQKGLNEKAEILAAIESLHASGSTYAEEGIRIGYEMAEEAYKDGFINRVILCSDGVANVGRTGADDILEVIKKKAERGITLSAIGFGMGNYNDVLLERLGDKGNGHYVYIDTIAEARRIFEDNLTGTLQVVARDVKVQVDFNPDVVRSYRLIGYENRDVPDEKFRDDKYDGGEVGAGHSVTALYELKLWPDKKGTVATTYVRYKDAESTTVTEFDNSIGTSDFGGNFDSSSREFRFAATVAEFAEILRKSYWAKGATLDIVLERAQQLSREFKDNADVIELADLISKAKQLMRKIDTDLSKTEDVVDEF